MLDLFATSSNYLPSIPNKVLVYLVELPIGSGEKVLPIEKLNKPSIVATQRKVRHTKHRVEVFLNKANFPNISIAEYPEIRYLFPNHEEIETKEEIAERLFQDRDMCKGLRIDDILTVIDNYLLIERETAKTNVIYYKQKKNNNAVLLHEKTEQTDVAIKSDMNGKIVVKSYYTKRDRVWLKKQIKNDKKLQYLIGIYYYLLKLDSCSVNDNDS